MVKTYFSSRSFEERLSSWSESSAKRLFDLVCALIALPLLMPVFLVIALAILFIFHKVRFFSCRSVPENTTGVSPF